MDSFSVDWKNSENNIFMNPRWPAEVQEFFKVEITKFISQQNISASIFIPTSGTTAADLRDTKIVWLTKEAFLKAARSVGEYFKFSSDDRIAVSLPHFHVGGLSQQARQEVWGHQLFYFQTAWNPEIFFQFLKDNRITHTSLVPTQLFDLVALGFQAPNGIKNIFIGGGILGHELQSRAQALGWPLQVTYGMTETAALVAVFERDVFSPLGHAQMALNAQGFLKISANSLFRGYLKRQNENLVLDSSSILNGWFTTDDLAEKSLDGFKILGRARDYAKINGEGVYLGRLQSLMQDSWMQADLPGFSPWILRFSDSERLGSEVHLVSTLTKNEAQRAIDIFNQKVLPFERIRGFHQVQEILFTELGKVRQQGIK